MTVEFGVALENFTPESKSPDMNSIVEYAAAAERLGLSSVWAWDHIFLGAKRAFPFFEALTTLGILASQTSRITLGTGVGTALFYDGRLLPHLEFAQHPFLKGDTYNEQLGDAARKDVGNQRWNKRVRKAVATFRALSFFDHCYIGGGNAKKIHGNIGADVSLVDNTAGILGGIRLWDESHIAV